MALSIEGKLINKLPSQTGEGKRGTWTKQNFILETFGEYPKKICFSAWNEKGEAVNNMQLNTTIKVQFSAESREYNERWYTDLKAYNISQVGGSQQTSKSKTNSEDTKPIGEEEEGDDLPF